MKKFRALEDLKLFIRNDKKGRRLIEAFEDYKLIPENVYCNVGDTLVFRYIDKCEIESQFLEAHKRYLDIHYILDGKTRLIYENTDKLHPKSVYDDITDTQVYENMEEMNEVEVLKGEIVVLEADEAFKFFDSSDIKKVIVKFTVENELF